jgi:hypothetical protein
MATGLSLFFSPPCLLRLETMLLCGALARLAVSGDKAMLENPAIKWRRLIAYLINGMRAVYLDWRSERRLRCNSALFALEPEEVRAVGRREEARILVDTELGAAVDDVQIAHRQMADAVGRREWRIFYPLHT